LRDVLKNKILDITTSSAKKKGKGTSTKKDFENLAFQVFEYQYKYNAFYQRYCSLIGKELSKINQLSEIPFLPIQFLKNNIIKTGIWNEEFIFTSSGTTGMTTSQHFVRELDFYNQLTIHGFEYFYGSITQYCVLGLLPAYLERSGSSLVTMVDDFIKRSPYPQSGFFLYDYHKLYEVLLKNKENNIPTLLIGVSFALLDFTEKYQMDFPELIVMETGGMKGRRREMIRAELHEEIKKGFNTQVIHSEYGMTELLSQGYSKGNGLYNPTSSMKALTRDMNDPLSILPNMGRLGVINIIDLGNLDTCSFIATDDLGRVYPDNTFEILGRLDNSDIRGCNLMMGNGR
jgi:hypothetical protein